MLNTPTTGRGFAACGTTAGDSTPRLRYDPHARHLLRDRPGKLEKAAGLCRWVKIGKTGRR